MLTIVKQLFSLLTAEQRHRFYILQILVLLMAFAEISGVAAFGPFMALVGDASLLEQDNVLADLYAFSSMSDPFDFILLIGVVVLIILAAASFVSILTVWKLSIFATCVGAEIASRLYAHYLNQNWLFHASGSSAQLVKQISIEAARLTEGVIQPIMIINAKIVLTLFISVALFLFDPLTAIVGVVVFSSAYLSMYALVKKTLMKNGSIISDVSTARFRLMNEAFGGIKEVILLGRVNYFIERFVSTGVVYGRSRGVNMALVQVPRYFMELIAFGAMISVIIMLIVMHEGDLGTILPILSIYGIAALKILPALQSIYANASTVRGNISAFHAIEKDLIDSQNISITTLPVANTRNIEIAESIGVEDVRFTYPGKEAPALDGVSLTIPTNSVVGIVGPSGSGKSTIVDILLALVEPQSGHILIDGVPIKDAESRRNLQNTIGFVPQSIFLSEGSIAENVAFGISPDFIDFSSVDRALKMAHLEELVQQLPEGVHTKVGERGVQLSGGQRQRIGIARALYHKAEILVFDEATSALDGITEKLIMDAIHDFAGKKTIIMVAHRLKTVQKCDVIFYLEKGQIVDQGTYYDLIERNEMFRKMANHA